jgi:hypothetical protein
MAIIRLGFPKIRLTVADANDIQIVLQDKMDETLHDALLPRFGSSGLNKGAFIVQ